jgi:predicted  nucleic acid-binding Zn-ribbon protein
MCREQRLVILSHLEKARARVAAREPLVTRYADQDMTELKKRLREPGLTLKDKLSLESQLETVQNEISLIHKLQAAFVAAIAAGISKVSDFMQRCMITMEDIMNWQRHDEVRFHCKQFLPQVASG